MKILTAIEHRDKARVFAKTILSGEESLLSLLIEMKACGSFLALGYSGVFEFCTQDLKLSESQSQYLKMVVQASEKAPKLIAAVENGELSFSEASRISPVVNEENLTHWIDQTKTLNQKELEREVTIANPNRKKPKEKIKAVEKDLSHLSVMISTETEASLKNLQDILSQKLGRAASLKDVIEWATKVTEEKFSPEKKAERAKKRKQPPKKAKPVVSSGNRMPVPKPVAHQVVRREGFQCTFIGLTGVRCQRKRWLDLHHPHKVSNGGKNIPENLTFLCSAHHRFIHSPNALRQQSVGPTSRLGT